MDERSFINALSDKNIQLSAKQESQFEQYYQLLVEWNKKVNLTAITDKQAVYLKHFYDSISPRFFHSFQPGMNICDIGAGAGFPSLPILITMPELSVTIVESLKKRVNFLDELVHELKLDNVELIHARAEDIGQDPNYRESFSVVTARAVARLSVLAELCLPLCKQGGTFIALKGSNAEEELKEANKAYRTLGGDMMANHLFELPEGEGDRSIICIEKVSKTPKKYPRKAGTPGKKPL